MLAGFGLNRWVGIRAGQRPFRCYSGPRESRDRRNLRDQSVTNIKIILSGSTWRSWVDRWPCVPINTAEPGRDLRGAARPNRQTQRPADPRGFQEWSGSSVAGRRNTRNASSTPACASVDRLSELTSPSVVTVSRICSAHRWQPGHMCQGEPRRRSWLSRPGRLRSVGDQFDDLAAAEHMRGGHWSLPPPGDAVGTRIVLWTVSALSPANGCGVTRSRDDAADPARSGTVVFLQRGPQGTSTRCTRMG